MIFVTVGTHEQGFDRLIEKLDELAGLGEISDVIIQKGFTKYKPEYCKSYDLIPANEMSKYMASADLVISHGGPATYMSAIAQGKPTLVVPRLSKFNEHVNDHQLDFAKKVNNKSNYNLTIITDMDALENAIKDKLNTNTINAKPQSNTEAFVNRFSNLLESLL